MSRPRSFSASRRTLGAALAVAVGASLLLASGASAGIFTPENGPTPNANRVATLYNLIVVIAALVFVAVEGMLIWSMIKFKARKGQVAAQIHGNTRLEVGWTVGAAVILVFITAVTFIQLNGIKNPEASDVDANGRRVADAGRNADGGVLFASTDQPAPPDRNALTVKVDGQQYVWRYQYPGPKRVYSYVDMVVPVGRTVVLEITADDVAHSWWIPELGGKQDAVPGYVNKAWFKVTRAGTFAGQCAEFCGRNHANMLARVKAVPPPEYQRFYDAKAAEVQAAQDAAARQRQQLQAEQAQQGEGSQ